ncbi:MAG TPA: hypothetical protein VFP72_14990, partial [Kineosporiaceae bacterium]|nr:hypothetical protein [Kineosporiaceae bacterium]
GRTSVDIHYPCGTRHHHGDRENAAQEARRANAKARSGRSRYRYTVEACPTHSGRYVVWEMTVTAFRALRRNRHRSARRPYQRAA